jgi:hypothetical protein
MAHRFRRPDDLRRARRRRLRAVVTTASPSDQGVGGRPAKQMTSAAEALWLGFDARSHHPVSAIRLPASMSASMSPASKRGAPSR